MFSNSCSSIIQNSSFLDEDFLPGALIGREEQLRTILLCLSPAKFGIKPINAWVYGQPGTGKTSTCRMVLQKLDQYGVTGLYINCWENPTYYSVLDKIMRELKVFGSEKLDSAFKLERLRKAISKHPLVLLLDEIDQPLNKDRGNILYNFSNMKNIGLIAVSNNKYILYDLDDRIKSRLNAQWVEFHPYNEDDLYDIISHRADIALATDSYNKSTLQKIAELAQNDARVAIQTLKNAACFAEMEVEEFIRHHHIEKGYNSAKHLKKTAILSKLSNHHRYLYSIVQDKCEVLSGDLWDNYVELCGKKKVKPIAQRTYSEYMKRLIESGLVTSERAMVKGKVRKFKLA